MKAIREYALQDDVLSCKVSFGVDDDGYLCPPSTMCISSKVGPDASEDQVFFRVDHVDGDLSPSVIIAEVQRFCQTLKQMYDL